MRFVSVLVRLVMMDLKEWSSPELNESKKCCADCKTTKTPLWRGGPAGPKTLCNACGIRYRKRGSCSRKREEVVVLHRTSSVVKKQRWKMLGEEEQAAVCLMALSCGFFTIPSLTAFQVT
ncbi:GATA transcription factor 16 [Vigna radiata var. radiata]|uniref:GATA transcription factor 16 n=1 Tax=Vigna radiata var. radiata TaxID=3916 RepID=A0A1S3TPC3_VIGRR|nr:GATA transcription factor 16 [Vigna radiata var. radiata]